MKRWTAHLFFPIARLGLCQMVASSQSPGHNGVSNIASAPRTRKNDHADGGSAERIETDTNKNHIPAKATVQNRRVKQRTAARMAGSKAKPRKRKKYFGVGWLPRNSRG